MGTGFRHQVANDAKTGGKLNLFRNLLRVAGEPGFSRDFSGLPKAPLNSLSFSATGVRGCHLCALGLGISQQGPLSGNYFRANKPEIVGCSILELMQQGRLISVQ